MDDGRTPSRIFVYGTLRRDAPMHALLGESVRPLGPARFRGRLWDCGGFPGVTDSRRAGDVVHGELYELPDEERETVFERLDRYEGDAFERAERPVTGADGQRRVAFVYLFLGSTRAARRIASGDYVAELRTRDPSALRG
jgi:gamma-glutamylcyclotransferase (GGCT)/AIG2-like uncharacterized protein YtfP